MVNETELIKIAQEKYPVGSYVRCLTGDDFELITTTLFKVHNDRIVNCNISGVPNTRVYFKERWAEIQIPQIKKYELW